MSDEQVRVLIVDDGGSIPGRAAAALTEDHDLDATVETSVEAALGTLQGTDVDCVVAGGVDEQAFLTAVRDRREDVPVVFLVDRGDEVPTDAIAAGGADYLYRFEVAEEGRYDRLAARVEAAVDRQRTRRELARETELLEAFASVVSHDLRNPLNVAHSSVELVRDDVDSDHLDRIARSLSRMNDIIEDALFFVREGDTAEDLSPVDLETMARDAWSSVETGEMDLVVEATGRVEADASLLKEALENLFENAREHGEATTVTVGPLAGDDEGDFYVADDGEGIADDRHDQVFETGYTTARTGTGLGLSIVREIATAHGWTVTVTESADGGARFELTGVTGR